MIRAGLVAVLVVAVGLAGCVGDNDPAMTGADLTGFDAWQVSLTDHLPTPDVAATADREERRGELAPPGSPRFAAFDALVEQFLAVHDVGAASVAVIQDGRLHVAYARSQDVTGDDWSATAYHVVAAGGSAAGTGGAGR